MKRFLITLLLAATALSQDAVAQSSRTYDDDIYTSGSSARGEDERRQTNTSSSSQQRNTQSTYGDDGYANNNGYGDDGYSSQGRSYDNDYVDYDDDYYYSTRINRFGNPFYNRGYYSAFNNPFWYDPFWYDPFWGYNPWYRPGISISFGGGGWGGGFGGGPYWNSYWGYNTWYGYGGFNSCYGYPVYAGGWNGGYWNGFNQGYYNGYWNGYYAGLTNGYYGGGYGYGGYGNSGWRQTSYGPRNSMNSGLRPGNRTAFNGGRQAFATNTVLNAGPRDGRRDATPGTLGTAPDRGAIRNNDAAAVRIPRTAATPATVPTDRSPRFSTTDRTAAVPDRAAAAPGTRYQTAPERDDRATATDRFGSTDRIRTDRAPREAAIERTPRFNNSADNGRSTPDDAVRAPRSFEQRQPTPRYNNGPAYEAPRNRSFGRSETVAPSRAERSFEQLREMNAPRVEQRRQRFESAPRQERPSFEQQAPRVERQQRFESAPRMESSPRESSPRMSAPQRSNDFGGGNRGGSFGGGSPAPSRGGGSFGGRR